MTDSAILLYLNIFLFMIVISIMIEDFPMTNKIAKPSEVYGRNVQE